MPSHICHEILPYVLDATFAICRIAPKYAVAYLCASRLRLRRCRRTAAAVFGLGIAERGLRAGRATVFASPIGVCRRPHASIDCLLRPRKRKRLCHLCPPARSDGVPGSDSYFAHPDVPRDVLAPTRHLRAVSRSALCAHKMAQNGRVHGHQETPSRTCRAATFARPWPCAHDLADATRNIGRRKEKRARKRERKDTEGH